VDEKKECWSRDEENFNYLSLNDLLDTYDELKPGDVVFVGDAKIPKVGRLCDADDVCDMIADRAYDIGGDYAEDCADVSPDGKAELNALLDAWIKKHCNLNFWEVVNVRQYEITADDLCLPELDEQKGQSNGN
jgi:hypothetical protein